MHTTFSERLANLRKERGLTQKEAAEQLGVSAALLSHYEKGIRECGLDFVIKCSKYYNVTTDYLLGISDNRNGISADVLSSIETTEGKSVRVLSQSTKYLLDLASTVTDGRNTNYVYDYFMLCAYRGALTLAKAGVLPKEMFKIDYSIARDLTSAAIALQDAKFVFIEDKSRTGYDDTPYAPLQTLISDAEEYVLSNYIL